MDSQGSPVRTKRPNGKSEDFSPMKTSARRAASKTSLKIKTSMKSKISKLNGLPGVRAYFKIERSLGTRPVITEFTEYGVDFEIPDEPSKKVVRETPLERSSGRCVSEVSNLSSVTCGKPKEDQISDDNVMLGCSSDDCSVWVHAICLGYPGMTQDHLHSMPHWYCVTHSTSRPAGILSSAPSPIINLADTSFATVNEEEDDDDGDSEYSFRLIE